MLHVTVEGFPSDVVRYPGHWMMTHVGCEPRVLLRRLCSILIVFGTSLSSSLREYELRS